MAHSTEVATDRAHAPGRIAGGPALPVSALMCVPYLGAVVGAIVALRFLAVAMVSPGRFKDIALLGLSVLAYAAVVFVALGRPLLMAAGTFAVSFAAISVLTPRLEGRT